VQGVAAGRLGPIGKSEPISIVKPEPPVTAGQGLGCPVHTTTPLGTQGSARSDVEGGMWRDGVSPLGSGARTIPVKAVVVGRATAESPGAGCGAGRDRMTRVLSRGSSVSRWRRGIRAWGRDEPATDEPAAWAGKRSAQGWARRPSRSRRLLSLCSFARVPAHRRIDDATRRASRTAHFTSLGPMKRRAARGSSVHRTGPGRNAVPLGDGRPLT
jgi:hypothetical protein